MAKNTTSLSNHLGVSRKSLEENGVFDSILGIDTKLFVDPKLLMTSDIEEFKESRKKIFEYITKLLKIHRMSVNSERLKKVAIDMLATPEPKGLCIGYGNKSDKGTSIPKTLANKILYSASEIISIGILDKEMVELLGLFVSGFGPDSLSDLIISIIYNDFCLYTQRVSNELKITTSKYSINGKDYRLPTHPYSGEQIIFIPSVLLRALPLASNWREIVEAASHNNKLRLEFNSALCPTISDNIKMIINKEGGNLEKAKSDLDKLLKFYQNIIIKPYNLKLDNKGYYSIQPYVDQQSPLLTPSFKPKNKKDLIFSIRELVSIFKRGIENNGGNKLLYRKSDTGKILEYKTQNEDVSQIIFYLIADQFCCNANILLARESNAGRGPVDFSLGTGYKEKILVEIKKSNNNNLLSGYTKQLKAYEKSENSTYSFYVVIEVKKPNPDSKKATQLSEIKRIIKERKEKNTPTPELIVIDGLIHPSPSKLK